MARAVVTGSGKRVAAVAGLLEQKGHEVHTAATADELGDLLDVACYVQLPVRVEPAGDNVVGRVRSFLTAGLLGRYALVERLLPAFAQGAVIVLAPGNTPEGALPDDERSRVALLHVLAHATRAELVARDVEVVVTGAVRTDAELVAYALRGGTDPASHQGANAVTDDQYQDWRTEIMGLGTGLA